MKSIYRRQLEIELRRIKLEILRIKAASHRPGTSEEILECFRAGIRGETSLPSFENISDKDR
jgi:plasmid stability protein